MTLLNDIQNYLADYLLYDKKLVVEKIDPFMANGLMVRGKDKINRIGFGVSASLGLFQKALSQNCEAIITHHTFNFPPVNRYDKIFQDRIAYLINNKISLFGYHFLLDAHPEVGNNTEILRIVGAKPTQPYVHRGSPWGWVGQMEEETSFETIQTELKKIGSTKTIIYNFGPKNIKKIAAVSGKGAPYPADMQWFVDQNIDLFITGEVHEWNRELFREASINFIAAGHYATETLGVKALMKKVKSTFADVEVEWLEYINEV